MTEVTLNPKFKPADGYRGPTEVETQALAAALTEAGEVTGDLLTVTLAGRIDPRALADLSVAVSSFVVNTLNLTSRVFGVDLGKPLDAALVRQRTQEFATKLREENERQLLESIQVKPGEAN